MNELTGGNPRRAEPVSKRVPDLDTERREFAIGEIMAIRRVVTPQFFKNQTREDMQAEKRSIELLTAGIEPEVVAAMCELAAKGYAEARSEDRKTYFDVNYILTFYREAFNKVFCDDADVKGMEYFGESLDPKTNVLSEFWRDGARTVTVRFRYPAEKLRKYIARGDRRFFTPKYFEFLYARSEEAIDKMEV